jgi:flagellar biosynthesis/type III secretory pathway M-ring protein FliF/YscJ
MLLQHGVELLAATVFLFIALKTLKGSKRGTLTAAHGSGAPPSGLAVHSVRRGLSAHEPDDVEPDPELIARMRVEELVRSDPRRVGEILSRWATENTKAAGAAR